VHRAALTVLCASRLTKIDWFAAFAEQFAPVRFQVAHTYWIHSAIESSCWNGGNTPGAASALEYFWLD
jgi:hypothetical protein